MNTHTITRKPADVFFAYLCFIFFGVHYLYLRRPGLQILYWITFGGAGLWLIYDLFTMHQKVDAYNAQYLGTGSTGSIYTNALNQRPSITPAQPTGSELSPAACIGIIALIAAIFLGTVYAKNPQLITQVMQSLSQSRTASTPEPRPARQQRQPFFTQANPGAPAPATATPADTTAQEERSSRVHRFSPITGQSTSHDRGSSYTRSIGGSNPANQ